jgi:hypothetical protein
VAHRDGVIGQGSVTVEREPTSMRLHVVVFGAGASVEDALAALRTRAEKTKNHALALGADAASVTVGRAEHYTLPDPYRPVMTALLRSRPAGGAPAAGARGAARVAASFTADWALPKKPFDQLLAFTHALQQDLLALDLSGAAEARKLTPAEEKAMADAGADTSGFADEDVGEPMFEFRAELPPDVLARARRQAFLQATAQARLLAAAAGRELGELRSVTDENDLSVPSVLRAPPAGGAEAARGDEPPAEETLFASGNVHGPLQQQVVVRVLYGFLPR